LPERYAGLTVYGEAVPTVDVNGLQMYYEWHGANDAPPLVLICGLGLDISEIPAVIEGLARRYHLLAFDNRGAGRTDKPDEPYSVEQMAADTAGLMRSVGLPHAAVLGISLGGRIALALALAERGMVDRLILASTGARVIHSRRRTVRMAILGTLGAIVRGAHPQPRYAFRRQLTASSAYDARARLGEIRIPTLILHGTRDRSMPLALADELQEGIPGSVLRTFPGGHIFLLTGGREQFLAAVNGSA
jgi:pimeloyl-ACP methyl ester carboxylesterase